LLEHVADRTNGEILSSFMSQYYAVASDIPGAILVQEKPTDARALERLTKARLIVPQRGTKKKLIRLGETNAKDFLERRELAMAADTDKADRALKQLAEALKLKTTPRRIEVYDISNIQGTSPVGSMIVFHDGRSARDQYRKFAIRSMQTPDDFAMMKEMLTRRFRHVAGRSPTGRGELAEPWARPDLIIVDGGAGQLSMAKAALAEASLTIPVAALAKEEEELYRPGIAKPLRLNRRSDALFLLQRMRDEAHRFAIGYFRSRHRKTTTRSSLDDVPGIGPTTKKKLLRQFGSVAGVKRANREELVRVIGDKRADALLEELG